MKKEVKEWIVDKNLTTDSFDSIMIGVIYNSGHSTLDDPDVRKWIEMHPNEFRLMLPLGRIKDRPKRLVPILYDLAFDGGDRQHPYAD